MHFASTLLGAVIATSALVAADANAVKQDISILSGYLNQLTGDTNQFNDTATSLPFALQVQIDAVNIEKILNQAATDASSSQTFSQQDSISIEQQLLSVSINVRQALSNIQNKASAFNDLKPIVLKSLYALKSDTDAFAKALAAKLDPSFAGAAPPIVSQIDGEFNAAIVAYGGKSQ